MVVIFVGIDPAMDGGFGLRAVGILVITLACAGAVVGAIHGLALVRLLRSVRLARDDS
jgi:NhaP-type Na+/H+ or K+/H+ antiporter